MVLDSKGNTLVQVMITAGIMSILALGLAQIITSQYREVKAIDEKTPQQPGWKAASPGNFSTDAQAACTGFINTVSGSETPGWSPSADKKYAKERKDMFDLNEVEYPVEFANYQRNSHIAVTTNAKGHLLWTQDYGKTDDNFMLIPRTVLIKKDVIGVLSSENLLIYTSGGSYKNMIPIGPNTPVVFGNEAIAYLVPAHLLNYQDYAGKLILETGEFPALQEWAYVILFKPEDKEFIAAIQFTGGPRPRTLPAKFDVYRKNIAKSLVKLRYSNKGTINGALLTTDNQKLFIIQGLKVSLLDTVNIMVESTFDLEFQGIQNASLDPKNNLIVIGLGTKDKHNRPFLSIYSLSGKLLWEYELRNPQLHQPPVSGSNGEVYIIDAGNLNYISDGKLKWTYPLKGVGKALMTVTKDNAVILLQGRILSLVNSSGKETFSLTVTKEEESFDAPPSVDSMGRIYIASDKKLYCFE
jgi:outer membrane protein assembly factor BamB